MEKKCDGPCPVKKAVQFLSGAWTLEIYWHLREGPKRFGELRRLLGKVSSKVLTERLRSMEELEVVNREVLTETYPPQVEYSLTPFGKSFIPIIDLIAIIGKKLLKKPKAPGDPRIESQL
jgi:DNA-binding HxlR family transcriptional regulator